MVKPYIDSLTALRGVMCLWVVLHNYRSVIQDLSFVGESTFLRDGYLAVDAFFVLSGFVLSYVHENDFKEGVTGDGYRRFLVLRLARIYPVHAFALAVLVAMVVASWLFANREGMSLADLQDNLSCVYLAANLLLVQAWGWAETNSWNTPSWSISVEFLCYLAFPFVFGLLARATRGWTAIGTTALAVVLMLGPLAILFGLAGLQTLDTSHDLGVVRGLFAFVAGILVHRATLHLPEVRAGSRWLALILGVYLLPVLVWDGGWVLTYLLSVPLILAAAVLRLRETPVARAVIAVGNISYSVYLLHYIPITVKHRLFGGLDSDSVRLLALTGVLALVFVAAFLTNRYIEKPARYAIRARLS